MQITLKFKPRWGGVVVGPNAATVSNNSPGQCTAPRMYLSTDHDVSDLAITPTGSDDILKQQSHTMYDLSTQRMYKINPSVTTYVDAAHSGSPTAQPNSVTWDQWQNTAGSGAAPTLYQGLKMWIEWFNPPPAGVNALSYLDIYATYTVSMRKLQE